MVDPGTGEIRESPQRASVSRIPSSGAAPLETLSDALAAATDAYAEALDGEAEAQNAFEAAFAKAFLVATVENVPVTIRSKYAEAQVVELKSAYNLAVARSKRHRAKVAELTNRLTAMQSHLKYVGYQDGGNR